MQTIGYGIGGELGLAAAVAALPPWRVVLVPTLGGLLVGALLHFVPGRRYHGIADVMEACALNGARMPVRSGLAGALAAAVSLLGSPNWWMQPSPGSPHRNLDAFGTIRLLSLTAGRDEAVPPVHAAVFHDRLARRFDDHAERFRHVDYPKSEHSMEPADWEQAVEESCEWFRRHLRPTR